MICLRRCSRWTAALMIAVSLWTWLPARPCLAALVDTEAASGCERAEGVRALLLVAINTSEVRQSLLAQGISPTEAEARVRCLTAAELETLARFDLPAGSGSFAPGLVYFLPFIAAALVILIIGVAAGWWFVSKA